MDFDEILLVLNINYNVLPLVHIKGLSKVIMQTAKCRCFQHMEVICISSPIIASKQEQFTPNQSHRMCIPSSREMS